MNRLYQILLPLLGLFFHWVELTEVLKIQVMDGDTVFVQTALFKGKLRLMKVDAPEMGQGYLNHEKGAGEFSKLCLEKLVKGPKLSFSFSHRDMYGRMLGELFIDGKNISWIMLKKGCTTLYPLAKFESKSEKSYYIQALIFAQRKRLGLWIRGGIMSPYHFRKQKKGRLNRPYLSKRISHRR